jgi:hypothetical protein
MSITEQIANGVPKPASASSRAPKAEGDEHGLDALVVAEAAERAADDRDVPTALGHGVDPDRVDDDPHDREQSEDRALGAGVERLSDGHRVDDDGHQERDRQRPQGGDVGLQAHAPDRAGYEPWCKS